MTVTNIAREYIAAIYGGSALGSPAYIAIDTGSQAWSNSTTGLTTESDRNLVSSIDLSTLQQVTWTVDFNSVEMSGLSLKGFGLFPLSSEGKTHAGDGFAALQFDGTEELQIQISLNVI